MRFLDLTIRNFRGFGPTGETISFGGDLILLFGPNGFGKTSVSEAVEWLFYGSTKRRKRGEQFSKPEYANSYANVHGGTPVEVTARIEIGGDTHTITRRLAPGETSQTYVDGYEAPLSGLGLQPIEAVYPVIAQHGLQTFILSKPKDRRDAISAALGLDELTAFKTSLEGARSSFQRTPPKPVTDARKDLAVQAPGLLGIAETVDVGKRWSKQPLEVDRGKDEKELLEAGRSLSGSMMEDVEGVLVDLRAARERVSKAVFDLDAYQPADEKILRRRSVLARAARINRSLQQLNRQTRTYLAQMASRYSAALLDFWIKGIEIAPVGDICPMCESPTLHAEHRRMLEGRIAASAEQIGSRKAIEATIKRISADTAQLRLDLKTLGIKPHISEPERLRLAEILPSSAGAIERFSLGHADISSVRASTIGLLQKVEEHVSGYLARLDAGGDLSALFLVHSEVNEAVRQMIASAVRAVTEYQVAFDVLNVLLGEKIANNKEIARIDAVGKSLRLLDRVALLERYAETLASSLELIRSVEREIQNKHNVLLATRGKEVKDFYDRLNVGADVGFSGMEPGNDSMMLHATSFGRPMSAAANLSECQLNCLGLATYLMRACSPGTPFGFVLLDDPVQSMDDGHAESFIADIVPHLLDDHGKQVIVLSHTQKIVDRLRDLNQHRPTRVYHFDSYAQDGPTLTEQVGLKMLVSEIKGGMVGNEKNREYAIDRMRVLAEEVIRAIHLKQEGQPPPPKYDRASASQLLPLFREITGTTQQEYVGLRDTIAFCDPAHHTEVGYAVPVRTNIQPHLDRLSGLIAKYDLA